MYIVTIQADAQYSSPALMKMKFGVQESTYGRLPAKFHLGIIAPYAG